LVKTVSKHYVIHKKHIDEDVEDLKAHWAHEEFFSAGTVAADIIYYAIGPVA